MFSNKKSGTWRVGRWMGGWVGSKSGNKDCYRSQKGFHIEPVELFLNEDVLYPLFEMSTGALPLMLSVL